MTPDPVLRRLQRQRRFERQFQHIYHAIPILRGPLERVKARGWWMVRVPLGFLFIAGGFLAILPIFGLWMIPVGLMLLAIDLPVLQGPVAGTSIRTRRWWEMRRRSWRERRAARRAK